MLQIAIWGIAMMLLVKGIDVLHRQRVAQDGERNGAPALALAAAVLAIGGAVLLVWMANKQASNTSGLPALVSFDNRDAALRAWQDASPEIKARVLSEMNERSKQAPSSGALTQPIDDTN
ncbi:hypothetical protein [Sphingomonas parapaucimobilis]|uniref:hypothetical protein n=1 Tax=Sphingomonas parapaucimobilis TaxID=28213 RepID=UPI00391AEC23